MNIFSYYNITNTLKMFTLKQNKYFYRSSENNLLSIQYIQYEYIHILKEYNVI